MAAKDNDDRKQDAAAKEPMIDMSQTAVKKMIGDARERGYITYDQLNNGFATRPGLIRPD